MKKSRSGFPTASSENPSMLARRYLALSKELENIGQLTLEGTAETIGSRPSLPLLDEVPPLVALNLGLYDDLLMNGFRAARGAARARAQARQTGRNEEKQRG
jgi:hypothetical protein